VLEGSSPAEVQEEIEKYEEQITTILSGTPSVSEEISDAIGTIETAFFEEVQVSGDATDGVVAAIGELYE
jgi:hypothetical protein